MRTLRHDQKNFNIRSAEILARRAETPVELRRVVSGIIEQVDREGDRAVLELTRKFDKASLDVNALRVRKSELRKARENLAPKTREVVSACRHNVTAFAKKSLQKDWVMNNAQGVKVGEVFQPFNRVGVYVPGGTAPLVSTSLMTVAIARVAGVEQIAVCTPPGQDACINPNLLYALECAGASEIYKVGGAQAIAAMGCGTDSIKPVDKIFGPGNSFVVEAKRQMFGRVSIDLLPGPSEVLVIADSSGRADWIASDLLAQAEHGGDSQVVLLTTSARLLGAVKDELKKQSKTLTRQEQVRKVLSSGTTLVLVRSLGQAVELANEYAAEHVSLVVKNEESILTRIRTAGAIFLGGYSPVALGDFLAGPSHTLPTGGAGKSFSGLTAEMFQRRTSIIKAGARSIVKSAPIVEAFAEIEGLDAHGRSARIRVE
jgi:histidinol dehydrogenase